SRKRAAFPRRPASLCGSRPQSRAPRSDRAQPLTQACPRPGLDLPVAALRLAVCRLEVLEPRVCLFDQQELFGFTIRHYGSPPGRDWPDRRSGLGRTPPGRLLPWRRRPCQAFSLTTSARSEEHTSELQSRENLVCRL